MPLFELNFIFFAMEKPVKKRKGDYPEGVSEGKQDCLTKNAFSQSATTIDNIPNEIMVKIFGYLDVVRKYKSRRVCQRWNLLLKSPPALRDMLVDRLFFMTDELRARFIKFDQCIARAMTPSVVHLHLAGVADSRFAAFARGGEPLLSPAICTVLHDPLSAATELQTISLEGGCVGVVDLMSLLTDSRPAKLRKLVLLDVVVQDLSTITHGVEPYSYDIFVNQGEIIVWDVEDDSIAESEQAVWNLVSRSCPALSDMRKQRLQEFIDESSDPVVLGRILEIVRKRQSPAAPINAAPGDWNRNVENLTALTQTDLEAYLSSIRNPLLTA